MRKLKPEKSNKKAKDPKTSVPFYSIIFNLICISITVSALLYAYIVTTRYQLQGEKEHNEAVAAFDAFDHFSTVDEKESYSKIEVAQLMEIAKDEYIQDGRDEILDYIRTTSVESGSTLDALRGVYKDYVILTNKNSHLFLPVNPNIPLNPYPAENFTKSDDGVLTYTDESGYTPYTGIDVSSHQGEIDWEQAGESGIDFVIIRAGYRGYSEGALLEDTEFINNIEGALSNDLHTGVYFFTQAVSEAEMQEEIDFTLDLIKDYEFDGPIVIDVEEVDNGGGRTATLTQEQRTNLVKYFCETIEKSGYTPMIYGNLRTAMIMLDIEKLKDYEMWYAYYSYPIYYPYDYSILQYSSTGRLPGIKTDVDLNFCFKPWWK